MEFVLANFNVCLTGTEHTQLPCYRRNGVFMWWLCSISFVHSCVVLHSFVLKT